ncbi:MAG TPA: CRTAC1 family protein [Thermoanaerobaculia bacterium]|nr:CRTAC1 family protein [Thermoanaerobaculia bacterium]
MGAAVGDYDNDGFQDLYVTGVGEDNILYHNNGDGTFTDITTSAEIGSGSAFHSGCAMGDFDGDGFLDIVIANTYDSWDRRDPQFVNAIDPALEPNQLFMQDRSDRSRIHFVDASASSGIQKIDGLPGGSFTWSVSAVDINQDGFTDILWTDTQGIPPSNPSEDRGYNRLFLNDGTGHFTDVSYRAKLNRQGSWMGLAFGDFNCDGNMDFFSTNLGAWLGNDESSPRWFLGQKDGTFTDPGVGDLKVLPFGWGTVATDYDNDGDQDIIFYGDDDVLTVLAMDNPGTVLQNPGCSANFTLDLKALKTDHRFREVNGVAKGDFNNDGFEDIATVASFRIVPQPKWFFPFSAVKGRFGTPLDDIAALQTQMTLRLNAGFLTYVPQTLPRGDLAIEMNSADNGNGWAAVQLVGSSGTLPKGKSNRDGIGAVLKFTPDGGKTVITPIIGGGSHASQSYLTAEFGLGSALKGTVDVLWPGGTKNRLYDVAKGQRVKIPEIPCSYSANWKNANQYNSCVRDAVNRLTAAKVISRAEGTRLYDSAARAFASR